jgi:transposase
MAKKKTLGKNRQIPEALTNTLIKQACEILRDGNFRQTAAGCVGVSKEIFYSWLKAGREDRDLWLKGEMKRNRYVDLLIRVEKAEAEAHADILVDVVESEDPRVKLKFLQFRYNKLYNNNPNAKVDDETGLETKIDVKELLAERLMELLEKT